LFGFCNQRAIAPFLGDGSFLIICPSTPSSCKCFESKELGAESLHKLAVNLLIFSVFDRYDHFYGHLIHFGVAFLHKSAE